MNAFGTVGYLIAAAGFLLLSVLMITSWRGRRHGLLLIGACVMTVCWAVAFSMHARTGALSAMTMYVIETAQDTAWVLALLAIAGAAVSTPLRRVAIAVCIGSFATLLLAWILEARGIFYSDPTRLLSAAQIVASLLGLTLIEQLFRNSTHTGRQNIKFFVLGVGALFSYDLFLFSHAELAGGVSVPIWNARGVVAALALPFIAVAARRAPDWSLDVFVSRHVVFYTATALVSGAYLAVMLAAGVYVRRVGGDWGAVGQVVFVAGAIVALAGILASGALRRHARVFISKHFYRNKYDYRVEWLRFIQTLSATEEQDARQAAVRAFAQILGSPAGVLYWREESGKRYAACAAWPLKHGDLGCQSSIDDGDLLQFLQRTQWVVDLKELRESPDVYGNIEVDEWLLKNEPLRIVSPLFLSRELVGVVVLFAPPPPFQLTYEDRDLLKTIGRHVATHIAQHDADRRLTENRQFEAYSRLTAFLMHDLKNSVAQLQLVVDNAERHRRNPDFVDDAIGTVANAVERMTKLIEQLRGRSVAERAARVSLAEAARQAVARCSERAPRPRLTCEEGCFVLADAARLEDVIEHVIRNAQDATPSEGDVRVDVQTRDDVVILSVHDNGCGMDDEFVRERLFRPFDSTKGAKGMGIGAYQVREYVRSLGGDVDVQSAAGSGTRFSITLPAAKAPPLAIAGHA